MSSKIEDQTVPRARLDFVSLYLKKRTGYFAVFIDSFSQFLYHIVHKKLYVRRARLSVAAYRRGGRADRLLENPSYRDWETSDQSLSYLEQRVADFVRQSSGSALVDCGKQATSGGKTSLTNSDRPSSAVLPKLRRFESTVRLK
jgi:hypothetical protein